jgi:hypothetical protein
MLVRPAKRGQPWRLALSSFWGPIRELQLHGCVKQKVNGRVSGVEANRSISADGRLWDSKSGVDAGRWSRRGSVRGAAYRESAHVGVGRRRSVRGPDGPRARPRRPLRPLSADSVSRLAAACACVTGVLLCFLCAGYSLATLSLEPKRRPLPCFLFPLSLEPNCRPLHQKKSGNKPPAALGHR